MFWFTVFMAIFTIIYVYILKPLQYWHFRRVPQYSLAKLLLENLRSIKPIEPVSELLKTIYHDFENLRYCGCYQFTSPILFLRDPELIKQITIRDFNYFYDRYSFIDLESQPVFGKNLFFLKGENWKDMRMILSPSFTAAKIKRICPLINICIMQFLDHLKKDDREVIPIEAHDVLQKLACDIIATSAFGITRNTFENPNNEFFAMASRLIKFDLKANLRIMFLIFFPRLAKYFKVYIMDQKVTGYFSRIIKENIRARERRGIVRQDMIQMLLEAKRKNRFYEVDIYEDEFEMFREIKHQDRRFRPSKMNDDHIIGQALIFFFAGYEGISCAMSFLAYELAVNPDIQQKLYREIKENMRNYGLEPTYDCLMNMKYMDMVVAENLRKAPIAQITDRVCTKQYIIQPVHPNERPVLLKVGDVVAFSVNTIHTDPKYFPNPDKFVPERFSKENKSKITSGSYLPFGAGPRYCVGAKFAQMEMKLVFYLLLAHYKIVIIDKTPIPLKLCKYQFSVQVEGGLWVGLKKRTD